MIERTSRERHFDPWIGVACAVLFIVTLTAFVGLLPYGHWQPDEYQNLVSYRRDADHFFWSRLATWSPRPVSELLVYAYLRAVDTLRQPLIAEALAVAWLILIACLIVPAFLYRRRCGGRLSDVMALPLCLLCLFLVGHPVAEMFYWPMAALAYMTTLAGIVLIFGVTEYGSGDSVRKHAVIALMLLIVSLTSEVGAMFVVVYTLAALISAWLWGATPTRRARSTGLFIALAVALEVLRRLMDGRVALNGETFGDARYIHHVIPSILASVPHAMWEWVSNSSLDIDPRHLIDGALAKLAFFVGAFVMAQRTSGLASRQDLRLPLMLACLAIVPLTLAAAYYQFGMMGCCERHATFRQCMDFVALAAGAGFLASVRWTTKWALKPSLLLGRGCLALSVIIGLASSLTALRSDYASRALLSISTRNLWQSGSAPGPAMQMRRVMPGQVVGGYPLLPAGNYVLASGVVPEMQAVLEFFGKSEASVTDATGDERQVFESRYDTNGFRSTK